MTEKRFIMNEVGCIVDLRDNNLKNYDGQETVDLMNELAEENVKLKKEIGDLYTDYKERVKEWCDDCKELQADNTKLIHEYLQLQKENNELKKQIKNSIKKADNMDCDCNPCVMEECVKKVIE